MIQVWFTENVEPRFSNDDKEEYNAFETQQVIPIGSIVDGRQLIRGLYHEYNFEEVILFLESLGKNPVICSIQNKQGEILSDDVNVDEYMKHIQEGDAGNTASGWVGFNEPPLPLPV